MPCARGAGALRDHRAPARVGAPRPARRGALRRPRARHRAVRRLSARFPFVATLPQAETEAVLAAVSPAPERGRGGHRGATARRRGRTRGDPAGRTRRRRRGAADRADRRARRRLDGALARLPRRRHVPTTTYADRYLMADIAVPDRPDADTAVVNIDRSGVLESFPLPGAAAGRRVGCRSRSGGRPGGGTRAATAGRPACPRRGIRRRRGRDRDGVRRASRGGPAAAPRATVRDRRHRARGEPDRRPGHEPRSAGCGRPRAAARALGARARSARRRARRMGAPPRALGRAGRPRSRRVNTVLGRPRRGAADRRAPHARARDADPLRPARGFAHGPTRWASTATA